MRRREFISLVGGVAATWPLAALAQQSALPVVAFVRDGSSEANARYVAAFRKGLNESGYVEGQNVSVEYHWLEGQYDRLPALLADLVHRQVAVIATLGNLTSVAAKAATSATPIVFGVTSLARPGGNATGTNFLVQETVAKRLRLLHELVPKAVRVAVLVNPSNPATTDATLQGTKEAAATLGLQLQILNANSIREIDAAFATLARERPDALFVGGDAFFVGRAVQLITLAAHNRIPAAYSLRVYAAVGGLMSYGTDIGDAFRQVGVYAGSVLKGAKPADLPVLQSTKFELVINLQTARVLGIEVPPGIISIADEVIE
jgi:putative ABC transport system substrate-binding protein